MMIQIPLELLNLHDDGFHLLVEVVVFEQNFKAVLDTGASRTVFDKTTVEAHLGSDVLVHSDLQSTGLGTNTMKSYSLFVPDLQLGLEEDGNRVWHVKNFPVAALDLSTINYAYEQMRFDPVIGVIGGDILHPYGAQIDYKKLELRLRKTKINK